MRCPNCGAYNIDNRKFCGECGKELQEAHARANEDKLPQTANGKKGSKQLTILVLMAVIFIVVLAVVWVALDSPLGATSETATIRIQSDTSWSGSLGTLESSRSVDGSGSQDFQLSGDVFSAVIQKNSETGYLTVSIVVDGVVKVTETTTAEYGVVSVAWADY